MAGRQERGQDTLQELAAAEIEPRRRHGPDRVRMPDRPADAQAWRDRLAEGVDLDDLVGIVQGEQGRNRLPFVAQGAIDIILEDQQLMFLGDVEQALALLEGKADSGRKLER